MLTKSADDLIKALHETPFGLYLDEIALPEKTKYRALNRLEDLGMIQRINLQPFLNKTRVVLTTRGQMYAYVLFFGD